MEKEIWKEIPGYVGKYEVSNLGRVRSVTRYVRNSVGSKTLVAGKLLSPQIDKAGYPRVLLSDNNYHKKLCTIHRLVAITFIPNPYNYPVVNHKDENKGNNIVSNLEWCTQSYTLSYNNGQKKRRERKVDMLDKETGELLKTFNSIDEASKTMNIDRVTISNVCSGRPNRHTAGGYKWRYVN